MRISRALLLLALAALLAPPAVAQQPPDAGAPAAARDDARDERAFADATRRLGEGDLAGARAALEALVAAAPEGRWADDALAEAAAIAEKQGDLGGARALWRRLLDEHPGSRLARRATARLGELTVTGGEGGVWDATAAEHERLVRAAAGAEEPARHYEALGALLERSQGYPRWFTAALWLGDAWARAGARRRAVTWYQRAADAATTDLERFRVGLALATVWSADGEFDRAERTLRGLTPPDDLSRMALADALDDVDQARSRARRALAARIALAACALIALVALRRRAGGWGRAARALWPPPLEVIYLVPVALLLAIVAQTGNLLAGRAVQLVLAGGVVITWLSGTTLELARHAGAAPARRTILAHVAVVAVATVALLYIAVAREQLLDLLAETWHRGHDMR